MTILEIVLISYIVLSQILTTVIFLKRKSGVLGRIIVLILFPFGLLTSFIEDWGNKE